MDDYAEGILEAGTHFPVPPRSPADVDMARDQVVAAATSRMLNEPLGLLAQGLNPSRFDDWMPGLNEAASLLAEPLEVVRQLSEAYVERRLIDSCFRLEMTAWLVMDDSPTLRADLHQLNDSLIDRGAAGAEALLVTYGLQMRPPMTWRDLATMVKAAVQGAMIRADVEGDEYDPTVLANTIKGLVMGLTYRADAEPAPSSIEEKSPRPVGE